MGIGKLIKEYMEAHDIRVADIATETGIPYTTLSSLISRDSTKVDIDVLVKICNYINCSPEDFSGNLPKYTKCNTVFGQRLKLLRKARNIKRDEIAEAVGISERAYKSYELNQREPNSTVLIALARYFDVTVDYLLGNDVQANIRCLEFADRVALVVSEYIKHPELQSEVEEILNIKNIEDKF